jgi:hypothetical protein
VNERVKLKMIRSVFLKLPPFAAETGHNCLQSMNCLSRNARLEKLSVWLSSQKMEAAVSVDVFAAFAERLNESIATKPNQSAMPSSLLIAESKTRV